MLVTLLRAGGWEEKQIEEARLLFRSSPAAGSRLIGDSVAPGVLPDIAEALLLPSQTDEQHLLPDTREQQEKPETEFLSSVEKPHEKQSLVEEDPAAPMRREDLPHNLPLRPFETSEHIWPFSRYRDIFYGEAEPSHSTEPPREAATKSIPPVPQTPIPFKTDDRIPAEEPQPAPAESPVVSSAGHIIPQDDRRAVSVGDEKLVITACVMLLTLLLLLGYMYSNGRL
jgi:hypothetical protein